MKKNRIKKYSFLALMLITFFTACDKDEATFVEPNHRVILTSEMDFGNKINPDEDMTFGDVSSGVISRTWTFPDNVVDVLRSDNDKTSTERTVEVTFSTPGDYNVTLNQVFKDNPFSEAYKNQASTSVLDTTIVIRVLPSVAISLSANYLNDDGTLGNSLNLSDNALNEVTASKQVRFSYTVNGEPDQFSWTLGQSGVDPTTFNGSEEELDVKYKSLGNYDFKFIASRARPGGADTIYVKDLIKVIPSTDPVFLDGIVAVDGKIDLEFSRDMDPDSFNASTFGVTLENGGNMLPVTIESAAIKSGENNKITLTLSETVYNDDIVKVSYTPGSLRTSDQVDATAFTDVQATFNLENVLNGSEYDYSFENTTNADWIISWGSSGVWDINTTQAQDGNSSAYVELPPNAGDGFTWVQHFNNGAQSKVNFKKGVTYEIGAWVYLIDNGNSTGFAPDVRFYWAPAGTGAYDWGAPAVAILSDDVPTNQWVYQRAFITFANDGDYDANIRGWNNKNPDTVKFYIDNISVSEVTLRP